MKKKLLFFITANLVLFFQVQSFAQAPNLGTCSGFALFTAVGAFDNTGASNVTGDIGTNVGAMTGFPPGTLTGNIYVADPTSSQAALDAIAAYNEMVAFACDSSIGINLGSNQILPPNTYCLGGASTLTGDLILDGQGDVNALFIFQINGAFSTSSFSNIILINGTSQCNVFWQINGALSLADSSNLKGTLLVNGAISLLEGATLSGRGISISGAISLANNVVGIGCVLAFNLPVQLINFTAVINGSNVQLNWSTLSEINNDYFTVQHAYNGLDFIDLKRINGNGNSSAILHYSMLDLDPYNGTSYYRLMQTDFDGNVTFSNLVTINFDIDLENQFAIYPNPCNEFTSITSSHEICDSTILIIYSSTGEEIKRNFLTSKITQIETNDLPSGIYFYQVSTNSTILQIGKLISL